MFSLVVPCSLEIYHLFSLSLFLLLSLLLLLLLLSHKVTIFIPLLLSIHLSSSSTNQFQKFLQSLRNPDRKSCFLINPHFISPNFTVIPMRIHPSSSSSPPLVASCSTSSSLLQSSSLNSSVSSSSSSIDYCYTRCEGLDLLVKAVVHVGGSCFLCVPFIQRRVIRRRKRAFWFRNSFITHELVKKEDDEKESEFCSKKEESGIEMISNKPKKRKRVMALPSKYQDSVLQPWKRRIRRGGSRSIDVD